MKVIVTNIERLKIRGMNKLHLQNSVALPMLKQIPSGYSTEALNAFMMCVAHESKRGEYLRQINGPALGLIQMEPATHNSTWKFGDSIWDNALICGIISQEQFNNHSHPKPERLVYDLAYNVFMFRQRMFMFTEKIPKDVHGISRYLKEYWNSAKGAAHDDSYFNDWKVW